MLRKVILAAALSIAATGLHAADLIGEGGQCRLVEPSRLLGIETNAELTEEVVKLMSEAVNVADDPTWVDSRRPAFVWASEAKVACGKAYGYLQSQYRDEDYINKCDCFHQRMQHYM